MSDERTLESQCYGECWAAKEEIADKDAQLCRLHADNERLREELRQSGIDHTRAEVERLKAERDEAVRAEREACAKVCEQLVGPYAEGVGSIRHTTHVCAAAIRARGQEPPR